ncbi:zinc finger protein 454-like [Drosophila montana]|uniref:zinc finger protein 454-like n=1 Tax=Drosophila montana TaxID=40370 RepID=UPI00313AE96C
MSIHCRTCREPIFNLKPRNIFSHENEDIRHNILAITGIKLFYDPCLPSHICSCCYLDLSHSMAFRERCLESEKQLAAVKKEGATKTKVFAVHSRQIDPLDDQDLSEDEIKFKNEFNDTLDNPENSTASVRKEDKLKIEERQKLSTPSHLSPRVRLMRCRDPSAPRQTATHPAKSVHTNPPKNGMQPFGSSSHPAIVSRYTTARPTASIAPRPSKSISKPGVQQKYQPPPRHDEVRKPYRYRPPPEEKKYVCDQCGWVFRDLSNMKDHALRHSGVKKFECEECRSKFFTRPLLLLHIRVHHKGEKPFVCKYCGMGFRNSPSRCRHERKYHANELPFECSLCTRTFISKISLEKHRLVHITGEATHSCKTCNKSFKGAQYLRNHYLTKFHLRRVNQMVKDDFDESEMTTISDEDIDFDFADSIIEELDE